MVQEYEFHNGPSLLIAVHQVSAIRARRVICYEASVYIRVLEVRRGGIRSYHLSIFLSIQSHQGSAAFYFFMKLYINNNFIPTLSL